MTRSQMTLDFAVGMSVFVIVVTFVLAFVPGMLQPFESGTSEETAAADRLADQLSAGMLVSDVRNPYILDRECTFVFFEDETRVPPLPDEGENTDGDGGFADPLSTGTITPECNFPDQPLGDRLALSAGSGAPLHVRIRLTADLNDVGLQGTDADEKPDTLCLDASENRVIEADDPGDDTDGNTACDITDGDDDIELETGESPPKSSSSVIVARRTITLEGGLADGTTEASLIVEVW